MYECKYFSGIAFVLSVGPSVCGWKAVLNLLSVPKFLVVSFHNSEVNRLPLSVMISLGMPCSRTICCMKSIANCRASRSFRHGIKWLILVRQSMTTSIVSYPFEFGKSVMKSIAIDHEGWSGTVTESTIIATIHCPDIGYCLFGISLVTYIPYHVSCTFPIVIVSYCVVPSFARLFTPLTSCTQLGYSTLPTMYYWISTSVAIPCLFDSITCIVSYILSPQCLCFRT